MKNRNTTSTVIVLALGCVMPLSKMQASGGPPGNCNTADGYQALFNVTTGLDNTAFGGSALRSDTTGSDNTGTGCGALVGNTTGGLNSATGSQALSRNTRGNGNTASGYRALYNNIDASDNVAIGYAALYQNTGPDNVAVGSAAGYRLTTGGSNIDIGNFGVAGESDTIRVGDSGLQNKTFIAGIRGVATGNDDAIPVVIDSAGQLGTTSSSRRFKTDIKPMDKASESILALNPVTFTHKDSNTGARQFGLIAEEVAKVNPNLVVRDKSGEIYTVRYDAVNAMLLNEFLKAHKKIEEQQATITRLRQEMHTVVARLNEQDSKIQKVNSQLQITKPAAKVALDNR